MSTETLETVEQKLDELEKAKHEGKVFALYAAGQGSNIVAIGRTYESMWKHGEQVLELPKDELRKKNYVFDHISLANARRIVNGVLPVPEPVKPRVKAPARPIGRANMTSADLQRFAQRAKLESEQVQEEDE